MEVSTSHNEILENSIYLLTLLSLIICSALISGSEVAFFSLKKSDIEQIEKSKSKKLIFLLKNPKRLLVNILISNNTVNILIILLFTISGDFLFKNLDYQFNFFLFKISFKFFVEVFLITFILLIFGELLPKIYATRNPKNFALFMTHILFFLDKILVFIAIPLIKISDVIENQLAKSKNKFSLENLSQALDLTAEKETTKKQKNILKGIISFGSTETVQIMKPRIDICAISKKASFSEVLKFVTEKGFSRNPIYEENIDQIVGVLYTKDLLPHLHKKTFHWLSLIKNPLFVPENKKLDDLLIEFQEQKNHLAIVVDEYGGTSGLVSLNDVIEEIVGEINDEFNENSLSYSKINKKNYVFNGKINLKDFCKILNLEEDFFKEDKGASETLAGLILEMLGKFPEKSKKINYKNLTFIVEAVDGKRIKQIKTSIS